MARSSIVLVLVLAGCALAGCGKRGPLEPPPGAPPPPTATADPRAGQIVTTSPSLLRSTSLKPEPVETIKRPEPRAPRPFLLDPLL